MFGDIYGFNNGQQGLAFLGIFVGGLITLPCYIFWIRRYLFPQFNHLSLKPEVILPPAFFGAFALSICLFWYGWAARLSIHWIVSLVESGSFTVSITTLFMPALSYLGMACPQYAVSVPAGNALLRTSCGVVFPLFVSPSGPHQLQLKLTKAFTRHELYSEILGLGRAAPYSRGYRTLHPIPFILFYVNPQY